MALCLLAACNLSTTPATPTTAPTQTPIGEGLPTEAAPVNDSQPAATNRPTLMPPPPVIGQPGITTTPLLLVTPLSTGAATLPAAGADDRYEVQARAGRKLGLNYDITVLTGTIDLTFQGPPGILWQKTFTITEKSRVEFEITQAGTYEILIERINFDGNYSFGWD